VRSFVLAAQLFSQDLLAQLGALDAERT